MSPNTNPSPHLSQGYGGTFFSYKNSFSWEKSSLANLWGGGIVLHGVFYNDQIMQGGTKSFTNSVNLKIFPGHGGRQT